MCLRSIRLRIYKIITIIIYHHCKFSTVDENWDNDLQIPTGHNDAKVKSSLRNKNELKIF